MMPSRIGTGTLRWTTTCNASASVSARTLQQIVSIKVLSTIASFAVLWRCCTDGKRQGSRDGHRVAASQFPGHSRSPHPAWQRRESYAKRPNGGFCRIPPTDLICWPVVCDATRAPGGQCSNSLTGRFRTTCGGSLPILEDMRGYGNTYSTASSNEKVNNA